MYKKILTIYFVLICCSAFAAGGLYFAQSTIDINQVSSASDSVLMHFENDLSDVVGNTWTNTTFTFTTDNPKFNEYSMDYTAGVLRSIALDSGDYSSLEFGTDDFTIEFWWNVVEITDTSPPTGPNIGGPYLYLNTGNPSTSYYFQAYCGAVTTYPSGFTWYPQIRVYDGLANTVASGLLGPAVAGDTWYHFCFERVSGVLYVYINGTLIDSAAFTNDFSSLTGVSIIQTAAGSQYTLEAKMDELRVTKGGYVYGGEFTPPTRPFGLEVQPCIKYSENGVMEFAP